MTLSSNKANIAEIVFWIEITKHVKHVFVCDFFVGLVIKLAVDYEDHTTSQNVMMAQVLVYSKGLEAALFWFYTSWCLVNDLFLEVLHLFEH